jgi:tetratricopeptide (TPR) repeat protein
MAGTESTPSLPVVEGETPSPLCNHLLEQARLRFEDELSEAELREGVTQALESLEQARVQTLANLERDGAKSDVLDAFERSFEEMQIALEDLEEFAASATAESHENVRGSVFRAASATVFAMTSLQNAQFADGPTDMPLFNALFKMKEGFIKGGVQAEQLQQALAGIVDMTKKAIEELLAADGEQPPQRDGLVRAYEEQIQSLEKVDKAVEAGDKQALETVFEQLLATSNSVKEAMGLLNVALMSEGPCRLERTNILLSAADTYQQGGIGADGFAESLDLFEVDLRDESTKFQELAAMPNDSDSIQQEIEGVKEAYDLHEDALSLFHEILEGEAETAEFANAKKTLIDASEKLSDHKEALTALGENEGKVSCVRCGNMNEPGSRVCNNCGAQLPQQTSVQSTMSYQESDGAADFGGELEITTNLERLFHAINEVAEERCNDDEFEEVLVWMDTLLANAHATMPEVPNMTPHPEFNEEAVQKIELVAEDLHEQRGVMLGGIEEFRVALGTLQSFFETRDKETLVQGVREVKGAAIKMQQAEKALEIIQQSIEEATRRAAEAEAESGGDSDQG